MPLDRNGAASLSDKLDFVGLAAATRTSSGGGGLGKPLPVGGPGPAMAADHVERSDYDAEFEFDPPSHGRHGVGHHANNRTGRSFSPTPAGLTFGLPMEGIDISDPDDVVPFPPSSPSPSSPSSASPPGSPLRQPSPPLVAPAAPVRPTSQSPPRTAMVAMAPLTITARGVAPHAYTELTTRYPSTIGMFATAVSDPATLPAAVAAVAVAVAMAAGLAAHIASMRPDFEEIVTDVDEIDAAMTSPGPWREMTQQRGPADAPASPSTETTETTTTAAAPHRPHFEAGYSFLAPSAAAHGFDSDHSDVDSDPQHSSGEGVIQHGDPCDAALEGQTPLPTGRSLGAVDGCTKGLGGGVARRLGLDSSSSAAGSDASASASESMDSETPPASPQMRHPDYTPEHYVRRGLLAPKKKKRPAAATVRDAKGKGTVHLSPSRGLLHAFKKKGAGRQRSAKRPAFTLSGHELMMLQTLHRRMRSSEVPNGMLTETLLIRCLMARSWNVADAEILLLNYARELCPEFDPLKIAAKDVLKQLQTGAMALTGGINVDGGPVIEFVAGRYNRDKHTPREVLRSMLYLIEQAYRTGGNDTLRYGVSIVMDLRSMALYAFDYKFIKLLFKTIQAWYPVQVHSIHIISNTLFVKTVVAMCGQTISRALRKKLKVHKACEGVFKWIFPDQLTVNFDGILNYQHGEWLYAQLLAEGEQDVGDSSGGSDSDPIRRKLGFARGEGDGGGSASSSLTGLPLTPAAKLPRSQSYGSVPGIRSRTPNTLETAQNSGLYSEMKGKMVGAVRLVGDLFRANRAARANVFISAEVNRPSAGRVGGRDI